MRHDSPSDDLRERAALYCTGALPPEEQWAMEEHLGAADCAVCEQEVRAFQQVAAAVAELGATAPRPELRQRLLEAVAGENAAGGEAGAGGIPAPAERAWKRWLGSDASVDLLLVRGTESPWEESGFPGVRVRRLFVDEAHDQVTMLVRMDPGAGYPAHRHSGPEECYVLHGDLRAGDVVLRAGDYQRLAPGSIHAEHHTQDGCTLFIVSSLHDEVLR